MTKLLSLDKALNTGWDNFKKYGVPSIILWNFIFFFSLITNFFYPQNETLFTIYQIVITIAIFYFSIVVFQVYLKAVRKKSFESSDLLIHPIKLLSIIGSGILIALPLLILALVTAVGFPITLIITAPLAVIYLIFANIYLSQTVFLIIDGKGPIQALQESYQLISGNGFRYFLFMMCLGGINLVGILCLGVGILFAGPLTEVLKAQLYVNLTE